jgi:hypothetical protein
MAIETYGYSYPTDTSEEAWAFAAPYLILLPEDAGQHRHGLRASHDALRWTVRAGAAWRRLPGDSHPGTRSMTRRGAGWRRAASRPWRRICAPCCAWPGGMPPGRARLSSTAARSAPRPRAGRGPAMTGPSDSGAPSCMPRSTPSATSWRCTAPRPTSRTAPRSARLPRGRPRPGRTGLYRGGPGQGRQGTRHQPGGRQTARGQARLRPAAAARGDRALLRLGRPLSPPRPRLRAPAPDRRRPPLRRLRPPHARQSHSPLRLGP